VTREIITDVLLALAVATVAAAALGVAVMPGAAARLHYVTPAAVVAPVLVALAIFVTEGLDENTGETVLAALIMIATAPFLSHATIRAIRARDIADRTHAEAHENTEAHENAEAFENAEALGKKDGP
jgi:multisubunit Na+/H+ antiporter MnhG subunit